MKWRRRKKRRNFEMRFYDCRWWNERNKLLLIFLNAKTINSFLEHYLSKEYLLFFAPSSIFFTSIPTNDAFNDNKEKIKSVYVCTIYIYIYIRIKRICTRIRIKIIFIQHTLWWISVRIDRISIKRFSKSDRFKCVSYMASRVAVTSV